MLALKYAVQRLKAVLQEIERLKDSDFPHTDSEVVLDRFKSIFLSRKIRLENIIDNNSEIDVAFGFCSESLVTLELLHPLLGNILRSTDIRNSFEVYRPLLNLFRKLIGPEIILILSSEWDYSPFVLNQILEMPNVAMIGLPASEAGNPLLIPLAGHELGHTA